MQSTTVVIKFRTKMLRGYICLILTVFHALGMEYNCSSCVDGRVFFPYLQRTDMYSSVSELSTAEYESTFIYTLSAAVLQCAGKLSAVELCYSTHQRDIVHAPPDGYLIFYMSILDKSGNFITVQDSIEVHSKPERQKCTTSKNPRYCCDIVDLNVGDVTLPNEDVVIGISIPVSTPKAKPLNYNFISKETYSQLPILMNGIRYDISTGTRMEPLPAVRFYLNPIVMPNELTRPDFHSPTGQHDVRASTSMMNTSMTSTSVSLSPILDNKKTSQSSEESISQISTTELFQKAEINKEQLPLIILGSTIAGAVLVLAIVIVVVFLIIIFIFYQVTKSSKAREIHLAQPEYRNNTYNEMLHESSNLTPHESKNNTTSEMPHESSNNEFLVPQRSNNVIRNDGCYSEIAYSYVRNVAEFTTPGLEPHLHTEPVYEIPADDINTLYGQLDKAGMDSVSRHNIRIGRALGSGNFGEVYQGVWDNHNIKVEVAIKVLKGGSNDDKVTFLKEAAIMGQFKHPNVVTMYGVVPDGEQIMLVLELLKRGDLRDYLLSMKTNYEEKITLEIDSHDLLSFCRQIASGMVYLSSKAFVHSDLAARNILVSENKICKIADFGMSHDLRDNNYYIAKGGMIPVKWTAPEALCYKKYSTASDVWSFGVVMYEIWSLGHKPFEDVSNGEVVPLLNSGYRLPPPPGCPRAIYKIMMSCWHPTAKCRPNFLEVSSSLCLSNSHLLHWTPEELNMAILLGGSLSLARNMYRDVQLQHQSGQIA